MKDAAQPGFSLKTVLSSSLMGAMGWLAFGEYRHRVPLVPATPAFPAFQDQQVWIANIYEGHRQWAMAHPGKIALAACGAVSVLIAMRQTYALWHNRILPKLHGTGLTGTVHELPQHKFDILQQLRTTPQGFYFLGLGTKRQPVYVSETDLDTHMHVMGPTGTGKTDSNINPLVFQDMLAKKGGALMEGKGSRKNLNKFKEMAAVAGRASDVRVFSIEHPQESNSYNPLHMGEHGDPLSTAERVFADFPLQEDGYYKNEAKALFYNLVRLLADTGKPFNLIDVRIAVTSDEALGYVLDLSSDARAKYEIKTQMAGLGRDRAKTFTGLRTALAEYDPGGRISELLNSYNPDIVIEDVVNKKQLVYFDLPINRYASLAPSIGKIVLRHLAFVGAERDTKPELYDHTPFSVSVDECDSFLFDHLLKSLTKLRSARMQFRLAHQSRGQLEAISDSFDKTLRENTRIAVQFQTLDAEHMELIAKAYGTRTTHKKTVRFGPGAFMTHINMGEASSREVQEFVVHPDALKALAPLGQAFVMRPSGVEPVSFAILPEFGVDPYDTVRKQPVEGLDLFGKFVGAHCEQMA